MKSKTNINKNLKIMLSVNYMMDSIIRQSDLKVNKAVKAVVLNTAALSYKLHKEEAISILLTNLAKILDIARDEGRHVNDDVALYILMCSINNTDIQKMYGMTSTNILDSLKVEFTSQDVSNMLVVYDFFREKYGKFNIASDSKVDFKKYAPKKVKRPRDVSSKPKKVKTKDKTKNVLKRKARKEIALNALRAKIKAIKAKKLQQENDNV